MISSLLAEEFYQTITEEQRLSALSSVIDFKLEPPDVDTILHDDYFLGSIWGKEGALFPVWEERLHEVYPNPIETHSVIVVKGAQGTGKSTFAKLVMIIDVIKLLCTANAERFFHLVFDKGIGFKFFNVYKWKSSGTMASPVLATIEEKGIPFFEEFWSAFPYGVNIDSAKNLDDIVSEDVLSVVLSEINELDFFSAKELIEAVFSRMESRFQRGWGLFNHVILDSSDKSVDSPIEDFLKNSPHAKNALVYSTPIWIAKPMFYFHGGSFVVYAGDSENKEFVVDHEYITDAKELQQDESLQNTLSVDFPKLDIDRFSIVPNELKDYYVADLPNALKVHSGISVLANTKFFSNSAMYESCFTLPQVTKDTFNVDFMSNETVFEHVREILNVLPKDRKIYGRCDLGVSKDHAGIALGYADSYKETRIKNAQDEDIIVKLPYIKVPVVFSLGRFEGEETCISKIEDFFLELNQYYDVALITHDQYQSKQMEQDLIRNGMRCEQLSVDKTTHSYSVSKRTLLDHRLEIAHNIILIREGKQLINYGDYIDHPAEGSKDQWDAVSGVISSIFDDGRDAVMPSKTKQMEEFTAMLDIINQARNNDYARIRRR